MRQLFQRLREADLKLNREKCNFFKSHIQYLGYLISGEGIKPLPEKLESIKEMPPPTTPKEVKQFLGLIGYYRKFVPRFANVARPLTNLTRLDQLFEWSDILCMGCHHHTIVNPAQHTLKKKTRTDVVANYL